MSRQGLQEAEIARQEPESDADGSESEGASSVIGSSVKGAETHCMPVCCTAGCFCHVTYVLLFLTYVVIFPLWCKWLLTAPKPFGYWGQEFPDFPRMPLHLTNLSLKEQAGPQIEMSPIPNSQSSCNYTCSSDLRGYRTSEMNFEITLRLNKPDLEGVAHSTYPVILTSEDFEHWMLAADRRDSAPSVFFDEVSKEDGRVYSSTQDRCAKPAARTYTDRKTYVIACVQWRPISATEPEKEDADDDDDDAAPGVLLAPGAADADDDDADGAEGAKGWSNDDLQQRCDVIGGVCGWPCNSDMPYSTIESCDAGVIDQAALDKILGKTGFGNATVHACMDPTRETCETSTEPFSSWGCHKCVVREMEERRRLRRRLRRLALGLPAPPGLPGALPGALPGLPGALPGALGDDDDDEDGEDDEDDENGDKEQIYTSLPRMMVKYAHPKAPEYDDLVSRPRVQILAAHSLEGPWEKLYDPIDPESDFAPPIPKGMPPKTDIYSVAEDEVRSMTLLSANKLQLSPSSCFGKRGPLYVVACAVNQSAYDDGSQWQNSKDSRFSPGQKVMPPPFNDRCVAVAGRCGHACEPHSGEHKIPHCLPNGYINMSSLVGEIPIQYNRVTPVFMFAYVLLFGFAVKTIMLCPGIFQPYKRCHYYDPEMTRSLKYILVVGVTGGGDEGKGTMVRNTIGMVSGLPPSCRCRFVVANNEEGHRLEMMTCWEKFCNVMASIPNFGGLSYEENLRQFMAMWCEETKQMKLDSVGGKVKNLDPSILARLCGKTTMAKIKKEDSWAKFPAQSMAKLTAAVEALENDLSTDYNKFTPMIPHRDYVRDWAPPDPTCTSLRMHFTSRAKPKEDPRNIMVQHVAVGTWYYKVPPNATPQQWLDLRKSCHEMIYAQADHDEVNAKVPLRSSHGKAGGLNFVDNYITIVNDRPENRYGTEQDEAPSLYGIADARHQFQPDFFISCVPCFFTESGALNRRVGFTQAPQHYPEYQDKFDYLDNNNAQFFRLNAMIRNCCGGVSSCGTNGMWQLHNRDNTTIWQRRLKRVRDRDSRLRTELIEREQFHTSCKIEDTASSLDRVLVGEYSHFVNRKLSYGMSKSPEGFLGAQQRWVEGAITLCLQWVTQNADAHGQAKRNGPLLWCVIIAFTFYVIALLRLVTIEYTSSLLVQLGLVKAADFDAFVRAPLSPIISGAYNALMAVRGGHSPNSYSYKVYEDMTLQFIVWLGTCIGAFFCLWVFTTMCKCCRKWLTFPNEMKWWGRLVISFDNLTYWIWFWTSFFWIGFNVYLAVFPATFHFNNVGMMSFMLAATFLNYALIVANSMRFSIMESVDANEIAFLSMDNIWRANQLFFMVGPIQGFSVFTGTKNFLSYLLYGQDIGGWAGGDLTQVSIAIVKYWTSMIIMASIACWVYLFCSHPTDVEYQSRRPGCIIFTFIAMDVLHPCIYLWTVGNKFTSEEAAKMSMLQKLSCSRWWKSKLAGAILNETTTNVFRYVAPAYNFMLPILVFYNAAFGVSGGFTLVAVGAGH